MTVYSIHPAQLHGRVNNKLPSCLPKPMAVLMIDEIRPHKVAKGLAGLLEC